MNTRKKRQLSNKGKSDDGSHELECSELNVVQIIEIDPSTPGHEPPDGCDVEYDGKFDYDKIRDSVKMQRQDDWPRLTKEAELAPALQVYKACREAAAYNILGPRITIPTCNRMDAWKSQSTGRDDDHWLMECIEMGFPMQYHGPPLRNETTPNHPSAQNFQDHVEEYIALEQKLGAIVGPFSEPPFTPWCNVAPLMTREKSNKKDRRIIVDLSFPPEKGPNAYVTRNKVFGQMVTHTLPTIQDVINIVIGLDFNVVLGSIDIARAYRNFRLEPLDWPLACISHRKQILRGHSDALWQQNKLCLYADDGSLRAKGANC